MNFTQRGLKVTIATVVIALASLAVKDLVLAMIAIAASLLILTDAFKLKGRLRNLSKTHAQPDVAEIRLIAGEEAEIDVKVDLGDILPIVKPPYEWVRVINVDHNQVKLRVNPQLSGVYTLDNLQLQHLSPLKLLEGKTSIPLKLGIKAYPRTLPWLIEAAKLLLGREGLGLGETTLKRKGSGLEYYETREYVPGDPFKFIDWKATARLNKLMVKDYFEEGVGAAYVIYNAKALGPITSDELSSHFISVMVGLAYINLPASLVIKMGDQTFFVAQRINSFEALKITIAYVMGQIKVPEWEIHELIEPSSATSIIKALNKARGEGLKKLFQYRKSHVHHTLKPILESKTMLEIAYIGLPIQDVKYLLDLAEEAALRRSRMKVYTSSRPWIDALNLEQAYQVYNSHQKTLQALRKRGVEIIFKPV